MKIALAEHEQCFAIEFEAETLADAALLVRFGIGAAKKIRSQQIIARQSGHINGSLVLAKSKTRVGDIR